MNIRNSILANLKSTLEGVTGMKKVVRWDIPMPSEMTSFPFAVVRDESEQYQIRENRAYIRKLSVAIDVYGKMARFNDDDEVADYACELLALVEDALDVDRTRGTSNGCPNAVDTLFVSNASVVNRGAEPHIMLTLNVSIVYRTALGNASRQAS